MSNIEHWYDNNSSVKIITALDDIGEPYSCAQWGNEYENFDVVPLILDDGIENLIWELFNTNFTWPSVVFIDHNMKIYAKNNLPGSGSAIPIIQAMIEECGVDCGFLDINETVFPYELEINQNYPNPFNPSTKIDYFVPNSDLVDINIYDIHGNMIDQIFSDYKSSGYHSIIWNPQNLSSGIYFINISQNKFSEKIKAIYTK